MPPPSMPGVLLWAYRDRHDHCQQMPRLAPSRIQLTTPPPDSRDSCSAWSGSFVGQRNTLHVQVPRSRPAGEMAEASSCTDCNISMIRPPAWATANSQRCLRGVASPPGGRICSGTDMTGECLRGLPLASPGLRDIQEYSDRYLAVLDTRKATEKRGCFGGRRSAVTGPFDP
jgi:hypothetical protein